MVLSACGMLVDERSRRSTRPPSRGGESAAAGSRQRGEACAAVAVAGGAGKFTLIYIDTKGAHHSPLSFSISSTWLKPSSASRGSSPSSMPFCVVFAIGVADGGLECKGRAGPLLAVVIGSASALAASGCASWRSALRSAHSTQHAARGRLQPAGSRHVPSLLQHPPLPSQSSPSTAHSTQPSSPLEL